LFTRVDEGVCDDEKVSTPSTTLFDPPGAMWRPVSPDLVKARWISLTIFFIPVAVGGMVAAFWGQVWVFYLVGAWLVLFAWLAWLAVRQVRALAYAETDEDLLFRSGVLRRSISTVPYGRMQYVDVMVGPIERVFGLSSLTVNTAAAGAAVRIPGLPTAEAARLRDTLASSVQSEQVGL
jgi:membrane protein YdbS with pleckstrin-like domain